MQSELGARYRRDGFVSPVRFLGRNEARLHRQQYEQAEAEHGSPHYKSKIHTLLRSAAELATRQDVLDVVEQLIGPDILVFDVTYIVKEAQSSSFVSWHQDLTCWGFSEDKQVSMWLALSDANEQSGCMRMMPGSHTNGQMAHEDIEDEDNVLHRGQTVAGVAGESAVMCPLAPGEASFHHGWTLHASESDP